MQRSGGGVAGDQLGAARSRRGKTIKAYPTAAAMTEASTTKFAGSGRPESAARASRYEKTENGWSQAASGQS